MTTYAYFSVCPWIRLLRDWLPLSITIPWQHAIGAHSHACIMNRQGGTRGYPSHTLLYCNETTCTCWLKQSPKSQPVYLPQTANINSTETALYLHLFVLSNLSKPILPHIMQAQCWSRPDTSSNCQLIESWDAFTVTNACYRYFDTIAYDRIRFCGHCSAAMVSTDESRTI